MYKSYLISLRTQFMHIIKTNLLVVYVELCVRRHFGNIVKNQNNNKFYILFQLLTLEGYNKSLTLEPIVH